MQNFGDKLSWRKWLMKVWLRLLMSLEFWCVQATLLFARLENWNAHVLQVLYCWVGWHFWYMRKLLSMELYLYPHCEIWSIWIKFLFLSCTYVCIISKCCFRLLYRVLFCATKQSANTSIWCIGPLLLYRVIFCATKQSSNTSCGIHLGRCHMRGVGVMCKGWHRSGVFWSPTSIWSSYSCTMGHDKHIGL